jgi:hypothetical protein
MTLISSILKGKENEVVDALSIRVNIMHVIVVVMHQSGLKRIILDGLVTDQHYL